MRKTGVRTIAAIGIGSFLFFILGEFVSLPSGISNTYISLQYGLLAFVATFFGPAAGFLTGLIGHFLVDVLSNEEHIWWSWITASAVFGSIIGLFANKVGLAGSEFEKKDIVKFNLGQIFANLIAWVIVAPVLDIIMYGEYWAEAFKQGIICAGVNIVTTAVVGTLLCIVYVSTKSGKENER